MNKVQKNSINFKYKSFVNVSNVLFWKGNIYIYKDLLTIKRYDLTEQMLNSHTTQACIYLFELTDTERVVKKNEITHT